MKTIMTNSGLLIPKTGGNCMASRGDGVLVPFPFTDLTAAHVCPAVVVGADDYNAHTGDIIVAMITSQPQTLPTDYELQDWSAAGLHFPSWVRAKMASLEQSLIQHTVGQLSDRDMTEVDARLRLALGL
jgi:mRNA-degrading endonuclease toxin of MazEF toxin-antitoxin module